MDTSPTQPSYHYQAKSNVVDENQATILDEMKDLRTNKPDQFDSYSVFFFPKASTPQC